VRKRSRTGGSGAPNGFEGLKNIPFDSAEIPTENGQSNFGCAGAKYAYFEDGLAVLLNHEWVYFDVSEE
jgi:hypothetical protein